jgi:hypothetical protein
MLCRRPCAVNVDVERTQRSDKPGHAVRPIQQREPIHGFLVADSPKSSNSLRFGYPTFL